MDERINTASGFSLDPAVLAEAQRRQAASMDANNAANVAAGLPVGMQWGGPRPAPLPPPAEQPAADSEVLRLALELVEAHDRAENIISGLKCGCEHCEAYGDREEAPPFSLGPKICDEPGCDRDEMIGGLCKRHATEGTADADQA